jgi:hypothetical protein
VAPFGSSFGAFGPSRRLRSGRSDFYETQSQPAPHSISSRRRAQLAEDRRKVELHRVLGDLQFPGDVTVAQAVRDEHQHLVLARRQLLDKFRIDTRPVHHEFQLTADRVRRRAGRRAPSSGVPRW